MSLATGTRIGSYEILSSLGAGGLVRPPSLAQEMLASFGETTPKPAAKAGRSPSWSGR